MCAVLTARGCSCAEINTKQVMVVLTPRPVRRVRQPTLEYGGDDADCRKHWDGDDQDVEDGHRDEHCGLDIGPSALTGGDVDPTMPTYHRRGGMVMEHTIHVPGR